MSKTENKESNEEVLYLKPSDRPYIETVLHERFDCRGGSEKEYELLVEYNYGPHYMSIPSFQMRAEVIYEEFRTVAKFARDGPVEVKHQSSTSPSLTPFVELNVRVMKDSMGGKIPSAGLGAVVDEMRRFQVDENKLPGSLNRGPAGSELDWKEHPFVVWSDGEPYARGWKRDINNGVGIHTTSKVSIDGFIGDDDIAIVNGNGVPATAVEEIWVGGEKWDRSEVGSIGWFVEYYEDASLKIRNNGKTASINIDD